MVIKDSELNSFSLATLPLFIILSNFIYDNNTNRIDNNNKKKKNSKSKMLYIYNVLSTKIY